MAITRRDIIASTAAVGAPLAAAPPAAAAASEVRRMPGRGFDIIVEKGLAVPMRDGVNLLTEVWRRSDVRGPALLARNPYDQIEWFSFLNHTYNGHPYRLIEQGYAVVLQRSRGTGGSEGVWYPFMVENDDGFDAIAWIARQPWCDGNVGMFGFSYLGGTQWHAAMTTPPALKAIAPGVTSANRYDGYYDIGGVMALNALGWSYQQALNATERAVERGEASAAEAAALRGVLARIDDQQRHRPLSDQPLLKRANWWPDWLAHPADDAYWDKVDAIGHADRVKVPALNISGWFDIFHTSSVNNYVQMRARAGTPAAREHQMLIIGPWTHSSVTGVYPQKSFGPSANGDADPFMTSIHRRFYDRWLKGKADALDGAPRVRVFVMGIDQWRDETDWPLPDTRFTDYFLQSGGKANTAAGDGVLATTKAAAVGMDSYRYDPKDPVPSVGGRTSLVNAGPSDQSKVEARPDVLCYSTPVLTEAVEVTGPVTLVLQVSSSARDTDFTGKLVDVFPDGRAIYLTDGIQRCRYRHGAAKPELMKPGRTYEVTVDIGHTANVFLPGHRIRLEVSSSNFPRFLPNTNSGGVIETDADADVVVAENRIHHGPAALSRVVLPIIRR